ncbi:MAG: histidine kinase [Prevotella sp.]|jgi:hypothetical protein|nr:histidine kinase [Prevotella sp.]
MREFFSKKYNRVIVCIWVLFLFFYWLQVASSVSILDATLNILIVYIPIVLVTNFLANVLLPRAIKKKTKWIFASQFIFCSILMGAMDIYLNKLYVLLGGVDPYEMFTARGSIWRQLFYGIFPMMIILNCTACGLRFYYERRKLEKAYLETRLQMLQTQVNPHFMFNMLNHVYMLMQKDPALSSLLLNKYSDIFRYQLYRGDTGTVPISSEIQFLKDVIDVEQMRWGKSLKIKCTWSVEDENTEIQPLLLIVFIENAFKHVSHSLSENGYVNIEVNEHGGRVFMYVENSRASRSLPAKRTNSSGLGLRNIKERLEILYPDAYDINIDETDSSYTVRLAINL